VSHHEQLKTCLRFCDGWRGLDAAILTIQYGQVPRVESLGQEGRRPRSAHMRHHHFPFPEARRRRSLGSTIIILLLGYSSRTTDSRHLRNDAIVLTTPAQEAGLSCLSRSYVNEQPGQPKEKKDFHEDSFCCMVRE